MKKIIATGAILAGIAVAPATAALTPAEESERLINAIDECDSAANFNACVDAAVGKFPGNAQNTQVIRSPRGSTYYLTRNTCKAKPAVAKKLRQQLVKERQRSAKLRLALKKGV